MAAPHGGIDATAVVNAPPVDRDYRDDVQATLWKPCVIDPGAMLEPGSVVQMGTVRATTVEKGAWIGCNTVLGHDAWVREGAEVMHGTAVGGHATIGRNARVGMGAVILPFVKVGDNARVGAGAVVTKDVPAGETWAGVPAKRMPHTSDEGLKEWGEWWDSTRLGEWPPAP
jgi:acetyltransferase-like isoleucine patch superfamily enzyme